MKDKLNVVYGAQFDVINPITGVRRYLGEVGDTFEDGRVLINRLGPCCSGFDVFKPEELEAILRPSFTAPRVDDGVRIARTKLFQ